MNSLLSPIGQRRSHQVTLSKGKRQKKRKRKDIRSAEEPEPEVLPTENDETSGPSIRYSETPDLHEFYTIGFNSTTRYLESLAQRAASNDKGMPGSPSGNVSIPPTSLAIHDPKPMVAVFVPRTGQPSIMYSHLPILAKMASLASPSEPAPRLVTLPAGAAELLSAALAIPRLGLIGLILGAPDTVSFIDFIRHNVPDVEVPWLQEIARGTYIPVNIKTIRTGVPLGDSNDSNPQKSSIADV